MCGGGGARCYGTAPPRPRAHIHLFIIVLYTIHSFNQSYLPIVKDLAERGNRVSMGLPIRPSSENDLDTPCYWALYERAFKYFFFIGDGSWMWGVRYART